MIKLVFLFIFSLECIFAGGFKQAEPKNHLPQVIINEGEKNTPEQPMSNRAEQVMKIFAAAYPRQIEKVEFRKGDWAVFLRDKWYYYAGGKLLPENLLENADSYSTQALYYYPKELPPWKDPTSEESERFSAVTKNLNDNPPRRSPDFFDDLWRIHNRDESYQRVKSFRFLGKPTMVHFMILEELSLVEDEILTAAKKNPQLQAWINNIGLVEAWNWRNIAQTYSRSYHSYGLAIDLLPKSLGTKESYWLWAKRRRDDWWNVSYNERYHPHDVIIKAFEKYGFTWGGKWTFYDTMHFEYRPEILIYNGIKVETQR